MSAVAAAGRGGRIGDPDRDTLPGLLRQQAQLRPDAVAMRKKDLGIWREITWAEYAEGVRSVALALQDAGLGFGDRAAIIADNDPEWLFADLGVQAIGGFSVGVYPTNVTDEVAHLISHSGPRIAFCGDQEQVDKVLDARESLPTLERIVVFDMRGLHTYDEPMLESFAGFLARGRAIHEREPGRYDALLDERRPDDVAVVGYTSGTTGKPKGAMLNHRSQITMAGIISDFIELDERGRDFCHFPLVHPAARVIDAYCPLLTGSSINFAESVDTTFDDLVEIAPTLLVGTPRVFERLKADVEIRIERAAWLKRVAYHSSMRALRWALAAQLESRTRPWHVAARLYGRFAAGRWVLDKLGLYRLRYVSCGGASVAPELLTYFWALGAPVFETYGQSETSGFAFAQRDYADMGTAGRPLRGVEGRIDEESGELLVRSPGVFMGYLNDSEATEAALGGGWYRTGDIARFDEQGRLVVLDRQKHVLHTSEGHELSPSEIENKLKLSPYVSDAMAIAEGRPYVTALVEIELNTVSDWAQRRNVPYTTLRSLTERPEVVALIEGQVREANLFLPPEKQMRSFRLLPRQLDAEDDELTPTRKIKRPVVERRFGELIEEMYSSDAVTAA